MGCKPVQDLDGRIFPFLDGLEALGFSREEVKAMVLRVSTLLLFSVGKLHVRAGRGWVDGWEWGGVGGGWGEGYACGFRVGCGRGVVDAALAGPCQGSLGPALAASHRGLCGGWAFARRRAAGWHV